MGAGIVVKRFHKILTASCLTTQRRDIETLIEFFIKPGSPVTF